jgi:FkbM family methyltransferase
MLLEVWFEQVYTRGFYIPRTGEVVVDAGANVGLFSIWVARNCPGCRVLAFEPFDENFRLLAENLASAHANNVRAIHGAVAGDSGVAVIADGGRRSQDHRLTDSAQASGQTVRTYSFADILALAGGEPIALFKCDIEGSEHALFERASSDDLRNVVRFAIEYHEHLAPGTVQLLIERLSPTHAVHVRDTGQPYGMLYAQQRNSGT